MMFMIHVLTMRMQFYEPSLPHVEVSAPTNILNQSCYKSSSWLKTPAILTIKAMYISTSKYKCTYIQVRY